MTSQFWFWLAVTFLLGINVGSFLNVVIYRLPLKLSVNEPKWSFCPNCKNDPPGSNRLSAIDLIPLVSYLALGRKCRRCKQPISPRYFIVELTTGLLFAALYARYHDSAPNTVSLILFAAVMAPIFCIDLETYTIPDSLNLLALAIPVGRDLWGAFQHEAGHSLIGGWLPRSVVGALSGGLIFGSVRILGWCWRRQEAMGLGDVLLARGMGAMFVSVTPVAWNILMFLPLWVMLSCMAGIIAYPIHSWLRKQAEKGEEAARAEQSLQASGNKATASGKSGLSKEPQPQALEATLDETFEPDGSTLKREILDVLWCLTLGDLVEYARGLLLRGHGRGPGAELGSDSDASPGMEDDWVPAATAIPFGPFLVIGFFATVFLGSWVMAHYIAYAFPHSPGG